MKKLNLIDEKELALIEQVNEVYLRKGMKKVTMDDMAKEIKVSKKTLYKYVKNRAELVNKSIQFHVNKDQNFIQSIQDQNLEPIAEIRALIDYVLDTLTKVSPEVHSDLEKYFPDAWQILNAHFTGFIYQSVVLNLERGQKNGDYRKDFNIDVIAKIFISKIDLIFDATLFPADKVTFVQVYLELIQYHLRGIVSEQGVKKLNKIDFNNI